MPLVLMTDIIWLNLEFLKQYTAPHYNLKGVDIFKVLQKYLTRLKWYVVSWILSFVDEVKSS